MKRTLVLMFTALLYVTVAHGQLKQVDAVKKQMETQNKDTIAWTHNGVFDLGLNQGFIHNVSAGGELASLAVNAIFSGNLTRLHGRDVWSNSLDMTYGLYYAYSNSFIPHKTDDRIDLTSKYGVRIDTTKNFYITGLFNFRSQFTRGYDYTLPHWDTTSTSRFLSPAYLTLAAGLEYRKGTDVSLFLSPIAGRVVLADKYYTMQSAQGAFGIDSGKTVRYELGAYFSGRYIVNFNKNMFLRTRLDLYSNYLAKDRKDPLGNVVKKDNPGNISWLWDNLYSYKISKYVNLAFSFTLTYDNDVPYSNTYTDANGNIVKKNLPGDNLGWLQVKELFTLGIEYKF